MISLYREHVSIRLEFEVTTYVQDGYVLPFNSRVAQST